MTNSPWRSILSAALNRNRNQPHSRYFQLATVQTDGYPANRTVVFRGFFADTNQLKIITDKRSQKIDQLNHQAWGEVCWYFTGTREQFRLAGKLTLVDENHPHTDFQLARTFQTMLVYSSLGPIPVKNEPTQKLFVHRNQTQLILYLTFACCCLTQ
jgi:pyridoxamine 5'-phosphate oxidase